MAILDSLPGVEIEILVDGKPLKEYKDDDLEDDPKSLKCYVEAVTGSVFKVQLKVEKGTKITRKVIRFDISIDGNWVAAKLRKLHYEREAWGVLVEGRNVGKGKIQEFCFSELETASDGHVKQEEALRAQRMGTIEVCVSFVDMGPLAPTPVEDALAEDPDFVSEKALKGRAITHGVGFKAPQTGGPTESYFTYNPEPEKIFRFVFSYHSLKALKDMLIIEPTPEPTPLEERDIDSLTREEMAELLKRARDRKQAEEAAQEAKIKIKRERSDDNPRPRKAARPSAGATQLEIDETGNSFREASTDTLGRVEPETIVID